MITDYRCMELHRLAVGLDDPFTKRVHGESEHPFRNPFQRDRDRIVHSRSFRRLEYKTQVFVNDESDHYRTRLTHTIEVSQITRTVCRSLGLNEDLGEVTALAHDLGHPPFGHAGERKLNQLTSQEYEHNKQTIRLLECLEHRYPEFRGLNLTLISLRSLMKHGLYKNSSLLDIYEQIPAPLESVAADLSDSIAYNCHDLDDGISGGYFSDDKLKELELWDEFYKSPEELGCPDRVAHHYAIRNILSYLVEDLVLNSAGRMKDSSFSNWQEAGRSNESVIGFSETGERRILQLKKFLHANLYRHPSVKSMSDNGMGIIETLFRIYTQKPELVPESYSRGDDGNVLDYIGGMTDRYAANEQARLSKLP
jgi:dGTPase